jgi:lysophospholipid acyltransferase (LPLAT)-like uncharacterized protein
MSTLDFRAAFHDRTVDTTYAGHRGPVIMLFWHEYILFPFYLRRHNDVAILLSQHRDADWLCAAARHRGFLTVRGSSTRGGVQALRELMQHCRQRSLAITPDGPRGPRRQMSAGPIYLSSKLQLPLVCCGLGYNAPWRLRTWDQFALPVPGSRARAVIGPRRVVPPRLDAAGLEAWRQRLEIELNGLCTQADEWARSDTNYFGSHRPQPQPRPWWYDGEREPRGSWGVPAIEPESEVFPRLFRAA